MPVYYNIIARGNPQDVKAPKKYYAQAKSNGEISLRDLANQISKRSTLSAVDVMAVLESLIELVPERIAQGEIVRLGDFGSFSLTISSEGSEKEEEVTSKNIKSNSLNFRPGKIVQNSLNAIEYRKIVSETAKETAKTAKKAK